MKFLKSICCVILGIMMSIVIGINAYAASPYNTSFALIASARLTNAENVMFTATLPSVPASDDGMLYLYALQPYEYSVPATAPLLGTQAASVNPTFTFSINNAAIGNMICNKFALCIKSGGKTVMIANAQYVTNPEVAATHTRPVQNVGFVEPYEKMMLYRVGEVPIETARLGNYSTAVIVNKADKDLINPGVNKGSGGVSKRMYYAFNAANLTGVTKLKSVMSTFCANSNVDEFIIGNEVNQRMWNYLGYTNWENYVREYAQAFRVSYNAIKSTNANAKVYISLDQMWNRDVKTTEYIDAADFLIMFNNIICSEGNIDWGLAFHPYLTPLTYARFWDMSKCPSGTYYANQITSGKMVSFQNLPVMTAMMVMPGMLSPKGGVRDIILPEIGVTQAQGVEVQAAAMVACYQAARNNPYIKRIYFHRMNEGGATNFSTTGISESVYQSLVAGNPGEYDAWAKNYIGITDWRQIIMY